MFLDLINEFVVLDFDLRDDESEHLERSSVSTLPPTPARRLDRKRLSEIQSLDVRYAEIAKTPSLAALVSDSEVS